MRGPEPLGQLEQESAALIDLVRNNDPATPVPSCPGWSLADLLAHTAGAQRWVLQVVSEGERYQERVLPEASGDPVAWAEESASLVLDLLRRTDPERPTWLPTRRPGTAAWWQRKAAVETALHRWDASAAVSDEPPPIDAQVAEAGIDELTEEFLPHMLRRLSAEAPQGTLVLRAHDSPVRTLELGGEESRTELAGSCSDLLLWMWNRPVNLDVIGRTEVLRRWTALSI